MSKTKNFDDLDCVIRDVALLKSGVLLTYNQSRLIAVNLRLQFGDNVTNEDIEKAVREL